MSKKNRDIEDIYHLHGKNREYVKGDATGQVSGGDLDTGFHHSGAYHNFFEGYTEVKKEKPNGKTKIERFYTDDWIVCANPKGKKIRIAAYWLMYLASFAAMLVASCIRCPSNSNIFGSVTLAIYVGGQILMLFPLVKYSINKSKMTHHDYKSSSKRMIIISIVVGAAAAVSAVAGIIVDVVEKSADGSSILRMLLLLVAAGISLTMVLLEKKLEYVKEVNDTVVDGEGFKIG